MRHLKILGVGLVAMFALSITALGSMATSAFAKVLPEISIVLGEKYPLHLYFADNKETPTKLENTGGKSLEGKGFLALLELNALGNLGTFDVLFLEVKQGKTTLCTGEGEKNGEVLVTGEWHAVTIEDKVLTSGVAFLIHLVLILCEKVRIHIEGCSLALLIGKNGVVVTSVGAISTGEKGKPQHKAFLNDELKPVTCILLSNFGTGFLESAEVINGGKEITLESLVGGKQFEITGL
jgi:hypothetical protein